MPTPKKLTMEEKHPELFMPQLDIDRRQCKRVVPMQVMNLGFPRTGTMSNHAQNPPRGVGPKTAIQAALNILGYTCYHSSAFFSNIRDCDMWNEAMDAKFSPPKNITTTTTTTTSPPAPFTLKDWDQLLGSYSAVSADPPAVAFASDLITTYPSAKVILVEREIESWYKSFDANVIAPQWSLLISIFSSLDPWLLGPVRRCHRRWATGWMGVHSREEMRAKARGFYREHYAMVRRVTPKERLLEFDIKDGWEPLCAFLGKEVPEGVPFPRVNDSEALQELLTIVIKRGLFNAFMRVVKGVLLPLLAATLLISLWVWLRFRSM